MHYPEFFDSIAKIEVFDPLSKVLGAFDEGAISFSYLDAVKLAGHSCPTVAGAYLMAKVGLEKLYENEKILRGDIELFFRDQKEEGVSGVTANVISMISGAGDEGAFKGLNQKFARNNRLHFGCEIKELLHMRRSDTNKSIALNYDPSSIIPSPKMQELMQKVLKNEANVSELREFASLWQDRVKRVLQSPNEVIRIKEI